MERNDDSVQRMRGRGQQNWQEIATLSEGSIYRWEIVSGDWNMPYYRVSSVNQDMTEVLAAEGEPLSYFEAESCAFNGLDKTYTYAFAGWDKAFDSITADGKEFRILTDFREWLRFAEMLADKTITAGEKASLCGADTPGL